jgi:DNA-binding response OmpR family regulator
LRRGQQLAELLTQPAALQKSGEPALAIGPLCIDAIQYRVWLNEKEVRLSAKEFALLEYLARQAGRVASPQKLIQVTHQLETDHIEAGALLRPLILTLRRKLDLAEGQPGSIENVRGIGYRLVTST